jgi:hypothetical protein
MVAVVVPLLRPVSVDVIEARVSLTGSPLYVVLQHEKEKARPIRRRWNARAGISSARDMDTIMIGACDVVVRVPLLINSNKERIHRRSGQFFN